MAENQVVPTNINLAGISDALTLIVKIANAVKDIPRFPELRRNEVREALAKSCQLVLKMLGDLREELGNIAKTSRKFPDAARTKLDGIEVTLRWQEKHRDLLLCHELEVTQQKLGNAILAGMSELTSADRLAFPDVQELKVKLGHFLDAEKCSGEMIAQNLDKLSKLAKKSAPMGLIQDELERIDGEIKIAEREFTELEIEIRKAIGA